MGNRQHLPIHQPINSTQSLNSSGNMHHEPLIASPVSSSPEAGILPTPTINSDVHIIGDTISLSKDHQSNILLLQASISSNSDCILTIYYFASEEMTSEGATLRYFYDATKNLEPSSTRYSAGINQQISIPLTSLDTDKLSPDELCISDGRIYPIVLEIKPVSSSQGVPHSEVSYLTFMSQRDGYGLKLLRQKLNYEDRCYNLYDIYCIPRGLSPEEESPDCVVCMTNRKDTSLLPCAHMCVCLFCANILRSQPNPKCPICRSAVATLLQIKVSDN